MGTSGVIYASANPELTNAKSSGGFELDIFSDPNETAKAEENSENTEMKSVAPTKKAVPDSIANYNSSCKFNFLFYFIYKVKYDENGDVTSKSMELTF